MLPNDQLYAIGNLQVTYAVFSAPNIYYTTSHAEVSFRFMDRK